MWYKTKVNAELQSVRNKLYIQIYTTYLPFQKKKSNWHTYKQIQVKEKIGAHTKQICSRKILFNSYEGIKLIKYIRENRLLSKTVHDVSNMHGEVYPTAAEIKVRRFRCNRIASYDLHLYRYRPKHLTIHASAYSDYKNN